MGMEFLSKFTGPLMVHSKLFTLVQGMISVAGPTNTQKDSVESHNFSTNKFPEVCINQMADQGDVLNITSTLISNSQTNICIYKVKSHADIAGNECADAIANY
eukprot:1153760-Pelagomonas_calceolata.AAC.1